MINNTTYGSFIGTDMQNYATSSASTYYPLYTYALVDGYMLSSRYYKVERIAGNQILYIKPANPTVINSSHKYSDLLDTFNKNVHRFHFKLRVDEEDTYLPCVKGLLRDPDNKILMAMAGRTNPCLLPANTFQLDDDDLILLVSTELATNSRYRNLYKRLHKEYIHVCHERGIEVSYQHTDKIDALMFSNDFRLEHNNLTELQNHLDTEVYTLLVRDTDEDLPF